MLFHLKTAHFLFFSAGTALLLCGCVPKALDVPPMQSISIDQKEIALQTAQGKFTTQEHSKIWWKTLDETRLEALI